MSLDCRLEATAGDDQVRFAFTVINPTGDPVTLRFRDASRVDVTVLEDDTERWRYGEDRLFAQVLGEETVDPDGRRRFQVTWIDPVPGEYTAVGELLARDRHCEARTTFSV